MSKTKRARIITSIRERIALGEVAVGDQLPPIRDLAADGQACRATASQAMAELINRGLVEYRPGAGHFVAEPPDTDETTFTCHWCEGAFTGPSTVGPAPLYCSDAHRQQALRQRHTEDRIEAQRRRIEALLRWLVADGHLTPMGERQLRAVIEAERVEDETGAALPR